MRLALATDGNLQLESETTEGPSCSATALDLNGGSGIERHLSHASIGSKAALSPALKKRKKSGLTVKFSGAGR